MLVVFGGRGMVTGAEELQCDTWQFDLHTGYWVKLKPSGPVCGAWLRWLV